MLEVDDITTTYGAVAALRHATLRVEQGEIVALVGPNGAGKTTLLNSIVGLLRPRSGAVRLDGVDVTGRAPDVLLRRGVALVPEHRRIFADLTVVENLTVAGSTTSGPVRRERLREVVERFPVLEAKWHTHAGYLSGGEAQQLAIARALMSGPRLVLMDEPSLGLSPTLVDVVFDLLVSLRAAGRTILLVEQNARRALEVADRAYVLRSGEVVDEGPGRELLDRTDLVSSYFGDET